MPLSYYSQAQIESVWMALNLNRQVPNNNANSGAGLNNPNNSINMFKWLKDALYLLGLTYPTLTFKTIAVSGQSNIVADQAADTLTIAAGTGITLTTNATTDTLTIASTSAANSFSTIRVNDYSDVVADSSSDILTLVGAGGLLISTNATTDTITFTAPSVVAQNVFTTIAVAGQSNVVADSSTDTLTLVGAGGLTITTDASTDTVTLTSPTITATNSFVNIIPTSGTTVVADSTTDTLTLTAGSGITITGDASTDTITIAATGGADTTIYSTDGTLAANRTMTMDGKFLKFLNSTAGLLDVTFDTDNLLVETGIAANNDYGKILLSAAGNGSLILMRNGADWVSQLNMANATAAIPTINLTRTVTSSFQTATLELGDTISSLYAGLPSSFMGLHINNNSGVSEQAYLYTSDNGVKLGVDNLADTDGTIVWQVIPEYTAQTHKGMVLAALTDPTDTTAIAKSSYPMEHHTLNFGNANVAPTNGQFTDSTYVTGDEGNFRYLYQVIIGVTSAAGGVETADIRLKDHMGATIWSNGGVDMAIAGSQTFNVGVNLDADTVYYGEIVGLGLTARGVSITLKTQ